MPASAVIVGGGIAGVTIARLLAQRGVGTTLLEKSGQLTSGATWHAAGLVTRFEPCGGTREDLRGLGGDEVAGRAGGVEQRVGHVDEHHVGEDVEAGGLLLGAEEEGDEEAEEQDRRDGADEQQRKRGHRGGGDGAGGGGGDEDGRDEEGELDERVAGEAREPIDAHLAGCR